MEIFNSSVSALSILGSFGFGFGVVIAMAIVIEVMRQAVKSTRGE